ncbi:hypothetical protein NPIL_72021 [Nephila pilipes]|uniref:Uncharacterized protein n=1 Tax=Nephila pilipes TaxID=299642 RepID=A0A8X6NIN9_NEPPI|nr:hypothetical protein NPIL_72021 [Nephila pilipes]
MTSQLICLQLIGHSAIKDILNSCWLANILQERVQSVKLCLPFKFPWRQLVSPFILKQSLELDSGIVLWDPVPRRLLVEGGEKADKVGMLWMLEDGDFKWTWYNTYYADKVDLFVPYNIFPNCYF